MYTFISNNCVLQYNAFTRTHIILEVHNTEIQNYMDACIKSRLSDSERSHCVTSTIMCQEKLYVSNYTLFQKAIENIANVFVIIST